MIFLWSMLGLVRAEEYTAFRLFWCIARKAGNVLDMFMMVSSELDVVQHLPYLHQQFFYGNFCDAAAPELRDVSLIPTEDCLALSMLSIHSADST